MDLESATHSSVDSKAIVLSNRLWNSRFSQAFEGTFGSECFKSLILKSQRIVPLEERENEDLRLKKVFAQPCHKSFNIIPFYTGVSSDGFAYIVLPFFESVSLDYQGKPFPERKALFTSCLQLIEELKLLGHNCDDICLEVFRTLPSGEIIYTGLFKNLHSQNATVGFSNDVPGVFCSPEEFVGGKLDVASNMYSLGILGYLTLGNIDSKLIDFKGGNKFLNENQPPSSVSTDVPSWVDAVLGNCLLLDPKQRISSVTHLLSLMQDPVGEWHLDLCLVKWNPETNIYIPLQDTIYVAKNSLPKLARISKKVFATLVVLIILVLALGVSIFVLGSLKLIGGSYAELGNYVRRNSQMEYGVTNKVDSRYVSRLLRIAESVDVVNPIVAQDIRLLILRKLDASHLPEIINWNDSSYEEVVYLSLAIGQPEGVELSLKDALVEKGVENARGKVLFEWLNDNIGSSQERYIPYLAMLILAEGGEKGELDKGFHGLMPVSHNGFFEALIKLDDSVLILAAIGHMGAMLEGFQLYGFLRHDNKEIRIATIEALNARNDLDSLKFILRGFQFEKDEEVREIYRKNHWVTRDREMPKSIQN